jgi:hypothetical protein
MAKSKQIKVCLTNRGDDTETPWALDLGPAPGPSGSRKVRLINVPFMHAKPTWGDSIVVSPVEDGFPTWDRDGTPWPQITSRLAEDGGRWAMIVDYAPHSDANDAFQALARACAEHDVVCEGAWGPRAGEPGRAYFAVGGDLEDGDVMKALRAAELPCELIQIHPEPQIRPKPKASAKPTGVAKPATKPSAVAKPNPKPARGTPAAVSKSAAQPRPSAPRTAEKTKSSAPAAARIAAKPAAKKPSKTQHAKRR